MSADNSLLTALRHLTPGGLARDVAAFVVIWVGITALGLVTRRLLLKAPSSGLEEPLSGTAELAVVVGLGICGYGALLLAVGFFPLLHEVPLTILSLLSGVLFIWVWRDAHQLICMLFAGLRDALRREWFVVLPALLVALGALSAGLRPPFASDEIAYHWAAPLLWAREGHWVASPYKFTNGFHLSSTIYTTAAVFKSSTAAHWTDTVTLGLLAIGTAALARRFGGNGALAAAAVIAIPVATGQSWFSYDDVFGASLVIAAAVVVVYRRGSRGRWTGGILLAGAVSVKPLMAFMSPFVLLLALMHPEDDKGQPYSRQLSRLSQVIIPSVLAGAVWVGYSLHFIGEVYQRTHLLIERHGYLPPDTFITLRIPTLVQALEVPLLPFATAIIGNDQPYGGRSSVVLVVFIPVMIVTAVKMAPADRRRLGRIAIPVVITYLVASSLIVTTRFLLVIYCGALAAATLTVAFWRLRSPGRYGPLVHWSFRLLTLAGLLDSIRHVATG
jgi:hypothetical protein